MSNFKSSSGASRRRHASATRFKLGAAAIAASAFLATSSVASAQNFIRGYQPSELLVTYKSGASSTGAHSSNARAGAQGVEAYPLFNTQKVRLPAGLSVAQAIARYSNDPNVAIAQPNYIYQTMVSPGGGRAPIVRPAPTPRPTPGPTPGSGSLVPVFPNDPLFRDQYGPIKVKAPQAWAVTTGSNDVVVAVLDTGVRYNHVDLQANMWRNVRRRNNGKTEGEIPGNGVDEDKNGYIDDFYGLDAVNNDSDPMDDQGHGTHCAGIVGAVSNNGLGIAGINWNVKIMALKWLGRDGFGDSSDLLECFQYMLRMKNRGVNVRVASCSFGSYQVAGAPADPLVKAMFDRTAAAGIISAVSAGNGDADGIGDDNATGAAFPANYTSPGIISVAASDINDNLAGFSNFGSPVALAAPGVGILSTYPFVETQDNSTTPPTIVQTPSIRAYRRLSGTSMAAPHVAGAAALLFAYKPQLSVAQVRRAIVSSVDVVPALTGRVTSNGRLNIYKALRFINPSLPDIGDDVTPPGGGTPTPTPPGGGIPTPTPPGNGGDVNTPLVNGNIVFTQQRINNNGFFFATINQIGAEGGAQTILQGGIRELQNPSISLLTGRVAFVVNLANAAEGRNLEDIVDRYKFRPGRERAATFSLPQNEIFVRNTDGSQIRITNDEANRVAPVDDREPSISPDGTRIVFTKRTILDDFGNFNDDIYVTSATLDISRPGAAPQQFKLVGDIGSTTSQESHATWSPDGTRVVFQSNRGTAANPTVKDSDIYIVNVPTGFTGTTLPNPVRLTTNPGDDVEPSIGPVREESRVARPNGQLVYASNRNDFTFEFAENYSFDGETYNFGEDYDIYLQDVSVENDTTNRSQRIVDTARQADLVLGGTGDVPTDYIDQNGTFPTDPTKPDDDNYSVDIAVWGDDRRPVMSADGRQVIFCSDSIFRDPAGLSGIIKNNNPDDDYDIVRVDINGRNFVRLTNDRPARNYQARDRATDFGTLTVNEDYEPSAGAVIDPNAVGGILSTEARGTTATNGGSKFVF